MLFCSFPAQAAVSLKVEISGLDDPLETNVHHYLEIEKKKDDEELTVRWVKKMYERAPEEIKEALQPYGYYLPDIDSSLTEHEGKWLASYAIDKGPPVVITTRDIQWEGEGAEEAVIRTSVQEYLENVGDTLIHSEYETAKSNFLNVALANGYPKAKIIKSEILIDLEKNTAEITLHMDTGSLYYLGEVTFKQNFLDPALLQDYVTIHPGDIYSYDALLEFQQNLLSSNFVREVTIEPMFDETVDQRVPLQVSLKPIAPYKLSYGLGYETNVGPRASIRGTDRLVNRYGHQADLYLKLSQKDRVFSAGYHVPVARRLTDRWVSSISYNYEETPTTVSDEYDVETAFVRRNLEDTHFYKGFIVRSIEDYTIGHDPGQTTKLLTFGGTTRHSVIEDDLYPQEGYYVFADLRGAAEAVLSDTSFTRVHFKGRYFFGFGENVRIDTRLELGGAWVDDFSVYPASLRYFAGGDDSVRGYTYQALGPVDDTGVVVGGKQVLTTSVEYDHRLAESWVAAIFVDAGNAFNDSLDKIYVGAGAGIRWLAPFGSLRVDLAWPVSEDYDLGDLKVHVGFGATL
jgi:translocation and assembly module TamA